ncbi:hypothetical protein Ancab_033564 [Ancistrocladus abbreviatus]
MEKFNTAGNDAGQDVAKIAGNLVYNALKLPHGQLIWIQIFAVVGVVMAFLLQPGSLRRLTSSTPFKIAGNLVYNALKLPHGQLIWIQIFAVVGVVMAFLLQPGSLRRLTSSTPFKIA